MIKIARLESLGETAIGNFRLSSMLEAQGKQLLALAEAVSELEAARASNPPDGEKNGDTAFILDGNVHEALASPRIPLPDVALLAWREYQARRTRDAIFDDPELFGEPAWDILLDLASAERNGALISVTSACIGSCVPPTTALRWLTVLERKGLVQREEDAHDKRRAYVRLTKAGAAKLKEYFAATRGS